MKGSSISSFQVWALEYMMSVKRWFVREVQDSVLKNFIYMTDPQRWRELFLTDGKQLEEEGVPMTDADIPSLERYLKQLEEKQTMNAGNIPAQGPEDGWQ